MVTLTNHVIPGPDLHCAGPWCLGDYCNIVLPSSVARGGSKPPIGLKSMQKVLLRPIFAPNMKTAPPKKFGSRSCEGLAVVCTRIVEFSRRAHPNSVKAFFFIWRSGVFGKKNPWNFWFRLEKPFEFQRRPFFWRSLVFGKKNPWNFWFRPEKLSNCNEDLFFFFEITCFRPEKPPQSRS